jgi:hypothetical protein
MTGFATLGGFWRRVAILFRHVIDGGKLWSYTPPHRLRSFKTVSPDAPSLLGIEAAPPGLRRRGTLERLD